MGIGGSVGMGVPLTLGVGVTGEREGGEELCL